MSVLFCDLETFSERDLKKCGTHAYAEVSEVLLFAYAFGMTAKPKVWDVTTGEPMPAELKAALFDPEIETVWHNGGMFDRTVLRHALPYELPISRVHDTMVRALCHGLPGSLDHLCDIYQVSMADAKAKNGKNLISMFCKLQPKNHKMRRLTRHTNPVEWAEFIEYAKKDITAMRVLYEKLPMWNYTGKERELWHLDQAINDRGFKVDLELAAAAVDAVKDTQIDLNEQAEEITFGDISKLSRRDQLLKYVLEAYGVSLPDLSKATLERRINDPDLPWMLRELLALRLEANATSTSKYKKLQLATSADGRLRGCLQFNGASRTGRWAGRTFQPQNLTRLNPVAVAKHYKTLHGINMKDLPNDEQDRLKDEYIELGIKALKGGYADLFTNNVMALTSACVRGCIVAPDGRKLVVSDLSNIEGRDAAWLADEGWKLDAFRAFDKKTGHDLYKLAYAKSFGIAPEEVTKDQRQVGKVQELALQYEGGVGAFLTFAMGYNIDLDKLAADVFPNIPPRIMAECRKFWGYKSKHRGTLGLSEQTFIACDALKRMWREAHPAIVSYWKELDETVRRAINKPGEEFICRKVTVRRDGSWLRIILPSGRALCYASPRLKDGKISYLGVNQYTRKWQRLSTYGGKLFENICQAVARDVMTDNMPEIDGIGYKIILTVHDELITEAPDTEDYNKGELNTMLACNPLWARDMPLASGGFEAYRYKKD